MIAFTLWSQRHYKFIFDIPILVIPKLKWSSNDFSSSFEPDDLGMIGIRIKERGGSDFYHIRHE